jgi:hypothetical protein
MKDKVIFDGIDLRTGKPLAQVRTGVMDAVKQKLGELISRFRPAPQQPSGLKAGIDPTKPEEAGWGVIFASGADADQQIRNALRGLLDLRKSQAKTRYKEYLDFDGYRDGESALEFLKRHQVTPGPIDPDQVPYYLLIVGDPEEIPFKIQYALDLQYAVGRIHFDTVAGYRRYAEGVVAAETGSRRSPKHAAFFGPSFDDFTTSACDLLVTPLAKLVQSPGWQVSAVTADDATKSALSKLLDGSESPGLLFTATHGAYFGADDPDLTKLQGALICKHKAGEVANLTQVFSGDDLRGGAPLPAMVTFHVACYGAGTPRHNDFPNAKVVLPKEKDVPEILTKKAFIAHLPKQLLAHPNGGALAVIAHVERAWTYSFSGEQSNKRLQHFTNTLNAIMAGHPVGCAMAFLNKRFAHLYSQLDAKLMKFRAGKLENLLSLGAMWLATNDARGYITIGDPAVRLPIRPPQAGPR